MSPNITLRYLDISITYSILYIKIENVFAKNMHQGVMKCEWLSSEYKMYQMAKIIIKYQFSGTNIKQH